MEEKSSLDLANQVPKKDADKMEIVGKIVETQPTVFQMLKESVFAGTIEQAKKHIVKNILEPDIKALLFNSFVGFMSVWIFGDDRSKQASSVSSYWKSSLNQSNVTSGRGMSQNAVTSDPTRVKDIAFADRRMAERVKQDLLAAQAENGGYVSVYKYYEIAGLKPSELTHPQKNYGWVELPDDLAIIQTPEGFHLDLNLTAINLQRALASRNVRQRY